MTSPASTTLERRLGCGAATMVNILYILVGLGLLTVGIGAYLWRAKRAAEWPFPATLMTGR